MRALLLAGVIAFGWAGAAQATFTVTFDEIGTSVVAVGTGSLNISGLPTSAISPYSFIDPSEGRIFNGSVGSASVKVYSFTPTSAPGPFGSGPFNEADFGSGDRVGFHRYSSSLAELTLPITYVSGSALSDSSTYLDSSYASLGLTPGNYTYSYANSSGTVSDSFIVQVDAPPVVVVPPPTSVPEPASIALLGFGIAGVVAARQRKPA